MESMCGVGTDPPATPPPPIRFFDNWNAGFDATWELDIWGRIRRQVEAADAEVEASVEDYRDTLVMLYAEIASNYMEARTQQERCGNETVHGGHVPIPHQTSQAWYT